MAFLPYAVMAVSAASAMKQGQAQSQSAEYNAQVATQNSQIAAAQGEAAAQAQSRSSQRTIGAMTAAFGASGVQASTGSPSDVLADSVRSATLDNLTTRYNYKLKGMGYDNQATLDNATAKSASEGSYLSTAGALLSGYSKIYSQGGGTGVPNFS